MTETIDKTQQVQLVMTTDFQHKPFTITGDYEAVAPLADGLEQYVPPKHQKPAVEAPVKPSQPEVLEGRKASIAAKLFDVVYHDTSYQELKERRIAERKLQHRQRIGLIVTDRCAKHEKLLQGVK